MTATTKKIQIYSWLNRPKKYSGLVCKKPSMTVPGQSVTPQEIIRTMTTGQKVPQIYHDVNLSEFDKMDAVERAAYLKNLASYNKQLEKNILYQADQYEQQAKVLALEKKFKQLQEQAKNATTINDDAK